MIVKIQTSEKSNGNKGSCESLVNYLMKENREGKTDELFFDYNLNEIGPKEVEVRIDSNKKKLGKADSKFYSIILSPSEDELKAIMDSEFNISKHQALKHYTSAVMDEYALNFNREGLKSGADLVYFAKIENERTHKGTDIEVQLEEKKSGELKEGDNTHIHIVISRKDITQKLKLSPLTNHKTTPPKYKSGNPTPKGFNRVDFFNNSEKVFDEIFKYERGKEHTFDFLNKQKKGLILSKKDRAEKMNGASQLAMAFEAFEDKVMMEHINKVQEEPKPTAPAPAPKPINHIERILKLERSNSEKYEMLRELRRQMNLNESVAMENKAIDKAFMDFRKIHNGKYLDYKKTITPQRSNGRYI